MTTAVLRDRRAENRARTRRAILDAARRLSVERGPSYGVEELAEWADVSRRTVFNHFATLNDITATLCAETLDGIIETFSHAAESTPIGGGSLAAVIEEVEQALRATDLVTAVCTMDRLGGISHAPDEKPSWIVGHGFALAARRLRAEVERRNPATDPLHVRLLVESLVSGVSVAAEHWVEQTGAVDDAASRAEWERLLTAVLHVVRNGHATHADADADLGHVDTPAVPTR